MHRIRMYFFFIYIIRRPEGTRYLQEFLQVRAREIQFDFFCCCRKCPATRQSRQVLLQAAPLHVDLLAHTSGHTPNCQTSRQQYIQQLKGNVLPYIVGTRYQHLSSSTKMAGNAPVGGNAYYHSCFHNTTTKSHTQVILKSYDCGDLYTTQSQSSAEDCTKDPKRNVLCKQEMAQKRSRNAHVALQCIPQFWCFSSASRIYNYNRWIWSILRLLNFLWRSNSSLLPDQQL